MQNDIRPSYSRGQDSSGSKENEEPNEAVSDNLPERETEKPIEEKVDEKRLEEEFGPPPAIEDEVSKSTRIHVRIKKRWLNAGFSKRQLLVVLGLTFILLGSIGIYWQVGKSNISGGTYGSQKLVIIPKTVPNNLSGLPVDPAVNNRPVTGVMIENSLDARPQSGLSDAGVVFEAIAEGGITRFLALYQDGQPKNLGPVRSVRPYFIQWCMSFDCSIAHVGGSPEALKNIKTWGTKDLDQFFNPGAYHRVSSRYAPHNMYTSISQLNKLEKQKGFGKSNFVGFGRKKEAPSKLPTATKINMNISSAYYNTAYIYNAKTNSYKRSEGGSPHIDANTKKQLAPKVLLVLIMSYGLESDGHHSTYANIGSGQLFVFQDGLVQKGTWSKTSNKDNLKLTDENGHPLKLNPGQTWITALSATNQLIYKK